MSICVRMPKEITDYREKIIFGLSLRQLLCFSLAVILALITFFVGSNWLHLPADLVEYLVIAEAIPLMAVGFVKKNGLTFEKYFALFLRHRFGRNRLPAKTIFAHNLSNQLLGKKKGQDDQPVCMVKLTRTQKRNEWQQREFERVFIPTQKTRALSRARVRQTIKAARRDYYSAKRAVATTAKETSRAQIRSGVCGVSAAV